MIGPFESTLQFARGEDSRDVLSSFRDEFWIPEDKGGKPRIYLTGNSLGLQPRIAAGFVNEVLYDWKTFGVDAHFAARNAWMSYHELMSASMASVVGALPSEVVIMNSLTVNLHLMMASFYRPTPERFGVLIEGGAFPSDQYVISSQIAWHGYDPAQGIHRINPRSGESHIRTDDITSYLEEHGQRIALVLLGGVNYYTGQFFEIEPITEAAHRNGSLVGVDLAHAAGNVPLLLHDWNVDFSVWCSYKYLNAGPGGPGSIFVHERHGRSFDLPRLSGWWGHDKETRFQMPDDFKPMQGAEGWQLSNPPILSMAALRASLDVFDRAGLGKLQIKSRRLTLFLEYLLGEKCPDISIMTPSDPSQRGAQLSLRIPGGRDVFDRLSARGVSTDWREPDVIRAAPVPLYNTFEDVFHFVEILFLALDR